MITLSNNTLSIDLLDPGNAADFTRLGPRFAHGGLVWQVTDRDAGALLTGPEWPETSPDPLNAQGLPDAFRHRTRDFKPYTWLDDTTGLAIGCGHITKLATGKIAITEPCRWKIETAPDRATFSTSDTFAGFSYALTREVLLAGRTVTIKSRLTNRGAAPLALEWFSHPFFDCTQGRIRARLPREIRMADNPGFALDAAGELTLKRRFLGTHDDHMEVVPWPRDVKCVFSVDHPRLAGIENELEGAEPFECVIWGNGNTFSIEPYVRLNLLPGETRPLAMRHTFLAPFS